MQSYADARFIRILAKFKKNIKSFQPREILEKLFIFSRVQITPTGNYKTLRKVKFPCKKICQACKIHDATYMHHIILLKHGGRNRKYNLMPICKECHVIIHGWMLYDGDYKLNKNYLNN